MPTYELGTSSSTAIQIYPTFDLEIMKKQIRSERRAPTGKMRRYIWGDYWTTKVPVQFMPGSEATVINSWFDVGANLLFFITSDTATEIHSVFITNDSSPLFKHTMPYDEYYEGEIELETY